MPAPTSPFPSDKGLKKPVCVLLVYLSRTISHVLNETDETSCGSSPGSLSLYANAARAVGRSLAENNIPLIYGGGRRGIMGKLIQGLATGQG